MPSSHIGSTTWSTSGISLPSTTTVSQDLQHAHAEAAPPPAATPTSTRQPVLLLLGGGMAAGKSSVRHLIGADVFWSKVQQPVIVEADAIKSQDTVFRELQRRFPEDPAIARLVHEYSTEVGWGWKLPEDCLYAVPSVCCAACVVCIPSYSPYFRLFTPCFHRFPHKRCLSQVSPLTPFPASLPYCTHMPTDGGESPCGGRQPAARHRV